MKILASLLFLFTLPAMGQVVNPPSGGGGSMVYPAGNGVPSVNTAGTAWGPTTPLVPVENYGAVGYTTFAAAVAGTDSSTPIQNCVNALTAGQCLLQPMFYKACGISVTTGSVGIEGVQGGTPLGPRSSQLVCTSASSTILSVTGPSYGSIMYGGKFSNFTLSRSVTPTGTATGMAITYAAPIVTSVLSVDSVRNFAFRGATGVIMDKDYAGWFGAVTIPAGTYYGYYLDDGGVGEVSNSSNFINSGMNATAIGTTPTTIGMHLTGTKINDLFAQTFQTNGATRGISINYTGTSTTDSIADIHFVNSILDFNGESAIVVNNTNAGAPLGLAGIEFSGGWANVSGANTNPVIDIESSTGVSVSHMNLSDTGSALRAVYLNGSSGNSIIGNSFSQFVAHGIEVNGGSSNVISSNKLIGSAGATQHIYLTGTSVSNVVSSNSLSSTGTVGVLVGPAVSSTTGIETNAIASSITLPVSYDIGAQSYLANPTTIANEIITGGIGALKAPWSNTAFYGQTFNNGDADGPAWRGVYAANHNIGWNVSNGGIPANCVAGEAVRYVSDLGESGGAVIGAIDSGGNLCGWNRVDVNSLKAKVYAIGSLPAANSLPAGTQVVVSDSLTFTSGTCTNGGSDYMIAVTNGSTWSCH